MLKKALKKLSLLMAVVMLFTATDFGTEASERDLCPGGSISCNSTVCVTLDTNGGKLDPASGIYTLSSNGMYCIQVEKGGHIAEMPKATKEGYDLTGWYTAISGGEKVTEKTVINEPITIYAGWCNHAGTLVTDPEVPATCLKTGLSEGAHCSKCGMITDEQEVLPLADHSYDEGTVTEKATLKADGLMTYTCIICKATKTEVIPQLDPDEDVDGEVKTDETTGELVFDVNIPEAVFFTGKDIVFSIEISALDAEKKAIKLAEGNDYVVTYENNKAVGTATVTVTGAGEYENLKPLVKNFDIEKVDINDVNRIAVSPDYTFASDRAGKTAVKPVVTFNGKKLKAGKDYEVYKLGEEGSETAYDCKEKLDSNTVLKIKGIGSFEGEKLVKVTFLETSDTRKLLSKAKVKCKKTQKYAGEPFEYYPEDVVVTIDGVVLENGVDYTISYANNEKVGKATMYITALPDSESYVGTKTVNFKIKGKSFAGVKFGLYIDDNKVSTKKGKEAAYTGTAIEPDVILTIMVDGEEEELSEGDDYTVTFLNNRTPGTATVIINGVNGYKGKKKMKFKIV